MDSVNEPVRVRGWVAIAVGTALYAALAWATDMTIKQGVISIMPMLGTAIGGLEWMRDVVAPMTKVRAVSPETADALDAGVTVHAHPG